jgi:hypothetical protein
MYPKWCCQKCGLCVGYLGRFFGWLKFPGSHYHGKTTIEKLWIIFIVLIFLILLNIK